MMRTTNTKNWSDQTFNANILLKSGVDIGAFYIYC
jgi:hypothetical protein